MENYLKLLEKFSQSKILVVGDVMLDRYWWGNVSRISPEAPVPVVNLEKTSVVAGGAANVAANIAGLGAETFLAGITGDDADGELIPEILEKSNISSEHLIKIKDRTTVVKTRIVAENQHIVRLDKEETTEISAEYSQMLWEKVEKLVELSNVVVISDYAKGTLSKDLLMRLITKTSEQNKILLIDPKGKNYEKYTGATLLTPNRKEVAEALKLDSLDFESVKNAGLELLEKFQLKALVITQGEEGMTLFQKDRKPLHIEALARQVYDVTGAGDTVIASLATALSTGEDYLPAVKFANLCAGIIVQQFGTAVINKELIFRAVQ